MRTVDANQWMGIFEEKMPMKTSDNFQKFE